MRFFTKTCVLIALSVIAAGNAYSGWFGGPNDYDECILESMKGVTSDVAAKLIRRSCREKFPRESQERKSVRLPDTVLQKIEGKAGMTDSGYYIGSIFNGSETWHITSLTVRIIDNNSDKYRDYDTSVSEGSYTTSLPPLSKGEFSFQPYDIPDDRSWIILSGRGYQQ